MRVNDVNAISCCKSKQATFKNREERVQKRNMYVFLYIVWYPILKTVFSAFHFTETPIAKYEQHPDGVSKVQRQDMVVMMYAMFVATTVDENNR